MIGQPQRHRRRPVVIALYTLPRRLSQSPMSSLEGVIEELQADQGVEGGIAFGKGVRLAGEGLEPIAQGPIESFDMHRASWLQAHAQGGADLHREQASTLIAMLDRLHQADRLWHDERRTPPFARQRWLAISSHQDIPIALPTIAEPRERAPVSPLDRATHRSLDQVLADQPGGAGNHEAAVPVLDQASPAFSFVRL